eukprot:TRINITY_DN28454_c0_g1_i1.p1 TRINITY_DN28454_c0_g1~~TRINITY_DN28454_c0_g1_i1.p1  ORF type:complete len:119 (-),score=29.26 TRINITY_DN28454_c0_g1_i1:112-468(-)
MGATHTMYTNAPVCITNHLNTAGATFQVSSYNQFSTLKKCVYQNADTALMLLWSYFPPNMSVKTLVFMVAVASYYHGAAFFSDNVEWFDAAQNFLMDHESRDTALGAQRVQKRYSYFA